MSSCNILLKSIHTFTDTSKSILDKEFSKNDRKYQSRSLYDIKDKYGDELHLAINGTTIGELASGSELLKENPSIQAIKANHGLDENANFSYAQLKYLQKNTGLALNKFASQIGNNVAKLINLKREKGETELSYKNKIMAFGYTGIATMIEEGILEEANVNFNEYLDMLNMNKEQRDIFLESNNIDKDKTEIKFIRLKKNSKKAKERLTFFSKLTKYKNQNGKNMLYDVFSPDKNIKVSTKPIRKVNTKIEDSVHELSKDSIHYKKMEFEQKDPFVRSNFSMNISDELLMLSAGWKNKDTIKMDALKEEQEAKNESIELDMQRLNDFKKIVKDEDKEHFYPYKIYINTRMMIDSLFSPQRSKIHRQISIKKTQRSSFLKNKDSDKHFEYKRAINQALFEEEKGTTRDGSFEDNVNNIFNEVVDKYGNLAKKIYSGSISSLKDMNKKEKELFSEAIDIEDTASLHALYDLGKYLYEKNKTHISEIAFETDAKNSGLAHKLLQYPILNNIHQHLQSVDIFKNKDQLRGTTDDAYVMFADHILKVKNNNFVEGLKGLVGDNKWGIRKLAKFPVLTNNYGAQITSIKRSLVDGTEKILLKKIEKILNSDNSKLKKTREIKKILKPFNVDTNINKIEKWKGFSANERKNLMSQLGFVEEYFDEQYGDITNILNAESSMQRMLFKMTNKVFEKIAEEEVAKYNSNIKDDEKYKRVKKWNELPLDKVNELKKIMGELGFYYDFDHVKINAFKAKNKNISDGVGTQFYFNGKTRTLRQRGTTFESLFTGGSVYYTHATEAIIQAEKVSGLNIFDASIDGLTKSKDIARKLNDGMAKIARERTQVTDTLTNAVRTFRTTKELMTKYMSLEEISDLINYINLSLSDEILLANNPSAQTIEGLFEYLKIKAKEVEEAKEKVYKDKLYVKNFEGADDAIASIENYSKNNIDDIDINGLLKDLFAMKQLKSLTKKEPPRMPKLNYTIDDVIKEFFNNEDTKGSDKEKKKSTIQSDIKKQSNTNNMNVLDLFNSFNSNLITSSHKEKLKDLLNIMMNNKDLQSIFNNIVIKLNKTNESIHRGTIGTYSNNINISLTKKKLNLYESKSPEEILVHELLHISAKKLFDIKNYQDYKTIENIYFETKKKLKEDDLLSSNPTMRERMYVSNVYNYLFGNDEDMDIKEQIEEFYVYMQTNEPLGNFVKNNITPKKDEYINIVKMINSIMDKIEPSEDLLKTIERNLLTRSGLAELLAKTNIVKEGLSYADKWIWEVIDEHKERLKKDTKEAYDKFTQEPQEEQFKAFMQKSKMDFMFNKIFGPELWNNLKKKTLSKAYSWSKEFGNTFKQVVGLPEELRYSRVMINKSRAMVEIKANNSEQKYSEIVKNIIKDKFNDKEKNHLTDIFYKTDMFMLETYNIDPYDMMDIKNVNYEIKDLENWFMRNNVANYPFFFKQSKRLADDLILDEDVKGVVIDNAYSIIKTSLSDKLIKKSIFEKANHDTDELRKISRQIDKLITLYSIKNVHKKYPNTIKKIDKDTFKKIYDFTSTTHKNYYKMMHHLPKSNKKNVLFKGINFDIRKAKKGKIPLQYRNNISYKLVKKEKIKELEDIGYILSSEKNRVKYNGDKYYLMARREYSIKSHLRGSISTFSESNETINISNIIDIDQDELEDFIDKVKDDIVKAIEKEDYKKEPQKIIPRFSLSSERIIYNIRLPIPKEIERNELEKETAIDRVSGFMKAEAETKVGSFNSNKMILDYLRGLEKKLPTFKNIDYIVVDEGSEYYNKLPAQIKKDINDKGSLWIPKMLINEIFGVDIISLTEFKPFKNFFENHQKLKRYTEVGEKLYADLISMNKYDEVVKTPDTWIGNLMSNTHYLGIRGYSPIEISQKGYQLSKIIQDYHKLKNREIELYASGLKKAEERSELKEVREKLKLNIVDWAFENGFYESFVEDIADGDAGINKNIIERKIKELRDKHIPETPKNILNQLYMEDSTYIGKMNQYILTHGDFFAKLIVFEKEVEEFENKHKRAITNNEKLNLMNEINVDFINYAIPQSMILEYLNKVGMFQYSKFIFGIPGTMIKAAVKHPASVVGSVLFEENVHEMETYDDSFNENLLSNRFRTIDQAIESIVLPKWFDILKGILK